jgi:hypothetical protein
VFAAFYVEKGTLVIDGGNSYKLYDPDNKLIKEAKNDMAIDARNKVNPSQALDALHIQNFFDGIRKGAPLNAEIEKGYRSTLLVQLGNIAVRAGNISFKTDPENGHILHNEAADKYWQRTYQPGWEPAV